MNRRRNRIIRSPYFIMTLMLVIILAVALSESYRLFIANQNAPIENFIEIPSSEVVTPAPIPQTITEETPLPAEASVKVPFTTQAPFANWDAVHEETCEEASLLMIRYFLEGKSFTSPNLAEQELLTLVDYENKNNYKVDVTLQELSDIARDFYGLKGGRVVKNITLDKMKREIASGKPIIIPASGKMLDNPNFKDGGPLYHMLVVKGYDKNGFITNDPGTRKGEGFRYTFDNLFNAIHDWNTNDINQGEKAFLVFD